jgi:hypothetical protein
MTLTDLRMRISSTSNHSRGVFAYCLISREAVIAPRYSRAHPVPVSISFGCRAPSNLSDRMLQLSAGLICHLNTAQTRLRTKGEEKPAQKQTLRGAVIAAAQQIDAGC